MRSGRAFLAVLLLFVFVFMTRAVRAQSVYGQVWGRLTTVAGTPVSGASVLLTSTTTGARIWTTSDAGGYITVANLAADLYLVDVRADGFKGMQSNIGVSADDTTQVSATLQAGDPNTLAPKTDEGPGALKLDRTDVSTQFDSRAIEDLPLFQRNLTNLERLVPGATIGELFIPTVQNPQGGQAFDINGQHFSGSSFQVDGTEIRDPLEGIVVINPALDSAQQIKITTQGYNADVGQATAGVVTVQTKSGGNSWHGDGFAYRETGFGQTQDPFDTPGIPASKYIIFGGSFGGSIVKDKLFIFGDYQGTRSSTGANLLLNVPSGTVRKTCLGPAGSGVQQDCDLSDYSPFINCHTHKGQTVCLTDSEGNPFSNYKIPNSGTPNTDDHVSPQAVALLALLPQPNHSPLTSDTNCTPASGQEAVCDNYVASGQNVFNNDQFDVRTDYNASSRVRLFGRYSFGNYYQKGAPAFGAAGGGEGTDPSTFAGIAQTRNQGISTGFTYTLNPKLLTDFRFGYFRYRLNLNALDYGQTVGTPGTSQIPNIFATDTHDPFATGLGYFEILGQPQTVADTGLSGGDYLRFGYSRDINVCNCPLREREQQFQFVDNWTRIAGKHIFKWGADLRFLQNYRLESAEPRTGYFDFTASATGLSLASFLLGDENAFVRTTSTPAATGAGEHQKRFGFYGQDTWRISSRLTVNYGLRWEIYFPQTLTGAGGFLIPSFTNHDPSTTYFNQPSATNSAGGVKASLKDFAPRLGVAYRINPTTVVRAGYGRSFDAGYAGDMFGIAATQNPPVTVEQKVEPPFFNLAQGPPLFTFPTGSKFSLLDLAIANPGNPNHNPPIPASGVPLLYALPPRVVVPTVDSWNLTLQHELTSRLYFELAYVGDKGTHVFPDSELGNFSNLNQPSLKNLIVPVVGNNFTNCKGKKDGVFSGTSGQYCLSQPTSRSFYKEVLDQSGNVLFDPSLFNVSYFGNNASDNYNSLQTKVVKNFSRGYSFMAHYTWSKGLDYDENYFYVDPRIGYGPASFDIRHRFVMTNIWDLPIGRGKAWLGGIGPTADYLLGGWTISAITVWQSGRPFTPSYSACAFDTDDRDPCQPNRVGTVRISGNRHQYFTTTGGQKLLGTDCVPSGIYCGVNANDGGKPIPGPEIPGNPWERPGAGQIGNAGRDSLYGPSFFQSDIALAKAIHVSEGVALHFRADAINAFNKVNLGKPNSSVDGPKGGMISSLGLNATMRLLQFSLRVEF